MEKKTGSSGTLVAPAAPTEALEADTADPGQVEEAKSTQRGTKKGKYGSLGAIQMGAIQGLERAMNPTWIGVEVKDNDGNPVPGLRFEVRSGENVVGGGTTDPEGKGRVEGLAAGTYKIAFPTLDEAVWEPG